MSNISNSRTSNGVLLKWNKKENGDFYFVKTGERSYSDFLPYFPISEFIAYKLGELLNLNVIETELENITVFNKEVLVSKTKSFLNEDEIFRSMTSFITNEEMTSQDLLGIIFNKFKNSEKYIYSMIVFDFIINNVDRHLNNFGFICNEIGEVKKFSPLFDNGNSLFSDLSNDRLKTPFMNLDRGSISKPFRTKQYKQIKLVPKEYLFYLESLKEIYDIIDSFKELSVSRKDLIKKLLEHRNNYLKGMV